MKENTNRVTIKGRFCRIYLNSRMGTFNRLFSKRLSSFALTVITLSLLILISSIGTAHAATYTVNSTSDDGSPGTLRWAITQANGNLGVDTIEFNISTADSGFNGQWWTINLSSALPTITEGVTINGSTQTVNQGDTNPGQVGWSTTHPGFTVGTGPDGVPATGDEMPFPSFEKLEIEINASGNNSIEIKTGVSNVTIEGLAIFNAQNGIRMYIGTNAGGKDNLIKGCIVGARANGSYPGDAFRISAFGIRVRCSNYARVSGCYVGWCGKVGIDGMIVFGPSTIDVEYCESFENGWATDNHDGIDINGINSSVRYCLSRNNTINDPINSSSDSGAGIEIGSTWDTPLSGQNIVEENTVFGNYHGIVAKNGECDNIIRNNVVFDNHGPGIIVSYEEMSATGNTISKNSIFNNDGLGIDLQYGDENGEGVTWNNGSYNAPYGNDEIDFPVITFAKLEGNTLHLEGYVGSAPGQLLFANADLEFFISSFDGVSNPNPGVSNDAFPYHGEGEVYLGNLVADVNGNFNGDIDVSGRDLRPNDWITATATDPNGNTSEFSENKKVIQLLPAMTPIGMFALIGLVSIALAMATVRRRK
jgi:parallel beta-helix repeat protein